MCIKPKVLVGKSQLNGQGMFACERFEAGQEIGEVELGPPIPQDKHSIQFNGTHRDVLSPWKFMNHSCDPNAQLDWQEDRDRLMLIALQEIFPQDEITMDYSLLREEISNHFECRCSKCLESSVPETV